MLWQILVQFVLRLALGLALAMAVTSPRRVTAGFYRVHLWVVLGLNTFAAAIVWLLREDMVNRQPTLVLAITAALVSYGSAVVWLYERQGLGLCCLWCVVALEFAAAMSATSPSGSANWVDAADILTAGGVLGSTFAAMLLGHWYLNTPSMRLGPLRRLIVLIVVATLVRAAICGGGVASQWGQDLLVRFPYPAFLTLRWLAGFLGVLVLAAMSWQTLRIPNTQSATGILYVGVIFVFLGELTSQLLSAQLPYPV